MKREKRRNHNCNCNRVGQPNEGCCSDLRLRDEGIKRTRTQGVYFADADLECNGGCFGVDQLISYDWSIEPFAGSNAIIVGCPSKLDDNTVQVAETGLFALGVNVSFRCFGNNVHTCLDQLDKLSPSKTCK
ncbi:hypothetical protein [Bacillus toyonensis]|uniref:hypothetical protein n=1 Tax=Bacillus toyonensis TaxID=155322 RepID=UPI003016E964